jgi:hypothetical protein
MPQDHDDFQTEPVRGLPEDLPEGNTSSGRVNRIGGR